MHVYGRLIVFTQAHPWSEIQLQNLTVKAAPAIRDPRPTPARRSVSALRCHTSLSVSLDRSIDSALRYELLYELF